MIGEMKNEIIVSNKDLIIVALVISLLISLFYAKSLSSVPTEAPDGWVMIEEDKLLPIIDESTAQMQQAYNHFLKKEYQSSSDKLKKVTTYINLAAVGSISK